MDVGDHDGNNHDNDKVEQPVSASRRSVGLATGLEGVDLGGIQPGKRQPGSTERSNVCEQSSDSTLGDLRRVVTRVATTGNQESHGQEHGKHLSSGTNKQQLATANTLNEEPRRCRKDGVDNHVNATKQKSKVLIAKDVGAQNREVVDNSVAATDLLHELRASAEKHATEVLCLSTGEQSLDGGALLSSETRSTDGVDNSVALSTGLVTVNLKASDGGDDLFGFFVAVVSEQPAG